MAVTNIDSSKRIVLSNADYLVITPYENEGKIGTKSYDIRDIVADTLSLTPDDNTVNAKEWEFGDSALFENITLGKIQFAATCIDYQNDVLREIFGWKEGTSAMYAPESYKDLYAVVEIGFKNENVAIVVPKLKLNSKAVISTLKTGTGEGQLAGSAYNANMKAGDETAYTSTPLAFVTKTAGTDGAIEEQDYTIKVGATEYNFTTGNSETSGIQAS